MDKSLETCAYRLKDMISLRKLFSELNYDFEDRPVNKDGWSKEQKEMVVESRIIASKNDYLIYYIQTNTDSTREWKGIASKIIKNHGLCMICSHNPNGFKWIFSSLSKEFSRSFSETRHVPIELKPDSGVPKTFVEFLEKIRVDQDQTVAQIVNKISDAFDSFAVQIHDELTINVFEALKTLSEGIILNKSNKLSLNENTLEEIRESTFILLYRIMFVLYAEDRSVFPSSKFYYDNFSLKWLKKEWILKNNAQIEKYEVQKRLNKLFRLIEVGSEELNYGPEKFLMRSYYGRLFDRKIHSKLEKWQIPNDTLLKAIGLLTRTHDNKGNYFFLDYSALETRHLGAVYEHLLEFHLTVKGGRVADLPNPKERKSTGSYYTPQYIVNYIVENTVGPLIDDIIKNTDDPSDQIDKILDLNILDPAMGSGHFLVGAVNYMAQRICQIQCANSQITEQIFVERKRDVARRCIYGVDINPLAVDLAQVSLWLETLSSEKPLSFLSAHLKVGNSLIGSSIDDILDKQTTLMESTSSRESFKKNVRDFIMLEMLDDDTADAVRTKTVKYDNMQSKGTIYSDLKLLLDAKVAKEFGVDVPPLGDFVAKIGEEGLDDHTKGRVWTEVRRTAWEHSFFHWDLEFPDIFYDNNGRSKEDPGFDGVIGNPPYINVEKLPRKMRKYLFDNYQCCEKRTDVYIAFMECSFSILNNTGQSCFIIPASFTKQQYAISMRQMLITKHTILELVDMSNYQVFESAQVLNIIIRMKKPKRSLPINIFVCDNKHSFNTKTKNEFFVKPQIFTKLKNLRFETNPHIEKFLKIRDSIWNKSIRLERICLIAYGARLNNNLTNAKKSHYIFKKSAPTRKQFCEGRDIDRYIAKQSGWLKYTPSEHYNPMFPELFENKKLMAINIVTNQLRFAYDVQNFYNSHTVINCVRLDLLTQSTHRTVKKALSGVDLTFVEKYDYKFLLGVLNSRLINWYFINFLSEDLHFFPTDAKELPIPCVNPKQQKPIIELVNDIIRIKKANVEGDIKQFETEIDKMVYKMYGLSKSHIKIINTCNL